MYNHTKILCTTICFAVSTAGCAPYAYKNEIASFATSTQAFSGAIDQVSADILAAKGKEAFWTAYAHTQSASEVRLDRTLCTAPVAKLEDRCALRVGNKTFRVTKAEFEAVELLEKLKAFARYSDALSAVANAGDRAAFDAAAGQLATKVTAFVGTVTGGAGAIIDPIVRASFAIQGLTLDHARLKQLQQSVAAVDEVLPAAAEDISRALISFKTAEIDGIRTRMGQANSALVASDTKSERAFLIGEIEGGAKRIATLQSQDTAKLVQAMVDAHAALATALNTPRANLADVAAEISRFSEIAQSFKAALAD